MAYRPPHRRDAPPRLDGAQHRPNDHSSDSSSRSNVQDSQRLPRVTDPSNRGGLSNRNVIQSTGGMRPSRLKEVEIDEMDMIQSVSRSGGDGAEGDALKDYAMQSRFRAYIDERIDKHYARFGTVRHTAPAPGHTDEIESLSSIVLLFRKLREGVVASGRIDEFAIEVFESSVRLAILAKHHAQLISSLSGLVPGLYQAVDRKGKGKATSLDTLADGLGNLALGARGARVEFASLRLLYQLVNDSSAFHETLLEITSPRLIRLYPKSSSRPVTHRLEPLLRRDQLSYALKASRALSPTTFNPLAYFALLQDAAVSGYERIVLSWATEKVRDRAWEVLRKGYISTDLTWAGRVCGLESEDEGEGWVKAKGANVMGTVVKLR